ncbi:MULTISPECIES: NAD(P)H-hydrate dehydratase [unclassified Ruegeria]|uniref:NAD(P)H-hydrate dehydratase n=1 Tax=unclassified Ruegeria TaxID=2625375 RepID=UPI001489F889|nr:MULTISPECIES: NAD(P)H-hydrate dehydratase [unclassified Ruegeria]
MTEVLTAAQMRAVEQAAIDSGEVTGLALMERAGQGVVDAILEEWPAFNDPRVSLSTSPESSEPDKGDAFRAVVLCGPGNNGGDGFVVARLLFQLGWQLEVFLYGDPDKLPPDARVNYERWLEIGTVAPLPEGVWLPQCDLHVDALFGTGLTRPVPESISYSLSYLHKRHPPFVAVSVDLPSGLCADSGRPIGVAGKADLTVTFHKAKCGHFLAEGPARCGNVRVADIGLPAPKFRSTDELVAYVSDPAREKMTGAQLKEYHERQKAEARSLVRLIDGPVSFGMRHADRKDNDAHKYTHGHALILSGGSGQTGAARLAARGALRIGAGLVTLGVPPAAQMEVACQITALMMRRVEGAEGLAEALQDQRLNALCLGPGLGLDRARALVPVALAAQRATVLDADALTAFGEDPDKLFDLLHPNCVLTPHGGEFARLFPDIAEKLTSAPTVGPAYSKVDATREAARRAGCVVLFKGPDTVIADPDGRCAINAAMYERAAPWLATAGSGDVLAGFITGLLARGIAPQSAAETAAWLHEECARQFGPGLIAEDLPEQLPAVLRNLLSDQKN